MTRRHTPGPWRIQATIYSRQPQIVNEHGAFVADTDAHNAHLIAASPDMADILHDIVLWNGEQNPKMLESSIRRGLRLLQTLGIEPLVNGTDNET